MAVPKIKVSPALKKKLAEIEEMLEDAVERRMTDVARTVVLASPVDTGAFVNSWSFKDNLGGGRSKSSRGKPRNQPDQPNKLAALNNLAKDINVALSGDSKRGYRKVGIEIPVGEYYFLNRAPHAQKVEDRYNIEDRVLRQHG